MRSRPLLLVFVSTVSKKIGLYGLKGSSCKWEAYVAKTGSVMSGLLGVISELKLGIHVLIICAVARVC